MRERMRAITIRILDLLAVKVRFVTLFLVLCYLTVMMQMVLAGASGLSLAMVGFIGAMVILLFWFLVRFWLGIAEQMRGPDV
jgi:hypothetical protein